MKSTASSLLVWEFVRAVCYAPRGYRLALARVLIPFLSTPSPKRQTADVCEFHSLDDYSSNQTRLAHLLGQPEQVPAPGEIDFLRSIQNRGIHYAGAIGSSDYFFDRHGEHSRSRSRRRGWHIDRIFQRAHRCCSAPAPSASARAACRYHRFPLALSRRSNQADRFRDPRSSPPTRRYCSRPYFPPIRFHSRVGTTRRAGVRLHRCRSPASMAITRFASRRALRAQCRLGHSSRYPTRNDGSKRKRKGRAARVWRAFGAEWLFDRWPFPKISGGNIGAVQLPSNKADIAPIALRLMALPFEMDPQSHRNMRQALYRSVADLT